MKKTTVYNKFSLMIIPIILGILIIIINLNNYVYAECKNCILNNDQKLSQNIEYTQNHKTIKFNIQNDNYKSNLIFSSRNIDESNNSNILDLCTGSLQCFSGIVTKVIDGDTLDVGEQRIRLSLINTPERDQTGYFASKSFVESICGVGTKVLVDQDDGHTQGSYGRLIGIVYCGNDKILLNEILLETKNAKILKKICTKSEFAHTKWAQKFGC
ncbi:MAG: thermonuclease family protein [Nitrososphaeraceae archaeon]